MSAVAPSPRTESQPMAFTTDEFLRGVVAAWLWFVGLFTVTLAVTEAAAYSGYSGSAWSWFWVVMLYAVPIGAIVAGFAALLFSPAAWWLGRILRRRRLILVHIVCFALLGAAVGTTSILVYALLDNAAPDFSNPFAVISVACSAVAVPFGWGWTVRRAFRADAGHGRRRARPRVDPDAEYEDGL